MITALRGLSQQEQINFLLTNRVPRKALTHLMGWWSGIESPLLARASIAVWKLFTDLDLSDAENQHFTSLRACFTRRLVSGARVVDPRPEIVSSPCDAIVGECGPIAGTTIFQAKGFPYELADLIPEARLQREFEDGRYVTLRLKSSMYHRFHAPVDCTTNEIHYISGDTWNVNPITLKRVERLFCRNERAVAEIDPVWPGSAVAMVPVAAILVGGIRFEFLPTPLTLRHRGQRAFACDVALPKGDEMGRFESGSTIVLLASGPFQLAPGVADGQRILVGQPLLRHTALSHDLGGHAS